MMADHQVYVIWANPLFRDSLRQLLDHEDILWVGASSDFTDAVEGISRLRPDTILIEEAEGKTTMSAFMKIVEQINWNLRVIGVSLNDNEMSIYEHAQQTVGNSEDLIRLIIQ
jgi:DNA-binding NarL/FixJ family response regulator